MVARTDRATDPSVVAGLAMARLGEASFRRALSNVSDPGFDEPTGLPGWSRRHLAAHVGYNGRAISRLVTWAATGTEHPMYASKESRAQEIELGSTLRPEALRSLCEHSAVELDVRWRDLPGDRWSTEVVTAQGRHVPVSETLWMRTREVWLHAVDLGTGLAVRDLPVAVQRRLVGDVVGAWNLRDPAAPWRLVESAAPHTGQSAQSWGAPNGPAVTSVEGGLGALTAWATGRGDGAGLVWSDGTHRAAPRWL